MFINSSVFLQVAIRWLKSSMLFVMPNLILAIRLFSATCFSFSILNSVAISCKDFILGSSACCTSCVNCFATASIFLPSCNDGSFNAFLTSSILFFILPKVLTCFCATSIVSLVTSISLICCTVFSISLI